MTGRRFILAEKPDGTRVAVGPVFKDASEAKLRAEVEAAGWRATEAVQQLSAADFRGRYGRTATGGTP